MPQSSPSLVTALLAKWRDGDERALESLILLVYNELRRVAHRYLRHEQPGDTLQNTALDHEAYFRLLKQGTHEFENRAHSLAISAQLMRQILIEYARQRKAAKRTSGHTVTLQEGMSLLRTKSVDLLALDDALNGSAELDARQTQIVELRFFGGLSVEETSSVLGISPVTVKREWATAKVCLHHEINRVA